jgi:ADP-ribosylglycohydrolase
MTIAVMDWCCHAENKSMKEAAKYLQKWARRYPNAGHGDSFDYRKDEIDTKPYNSCSNGAAIRISAVGWMFDNEEDLKEVLFPIKASCFTPIK